VGEPLDAIPGRVNWSSTPQRRIEAVLEGQSRALQMAVQGADLRSILEVLTSAVEAQSSSGALASILLMERDGRHLRHGAAPSLPDAYNRTMDGLAVGPSAASCGTAAHLGRTVVVHDVLSDPLWADHREPASRCGLRACWSTPILDSRRRVLGTFAVYHRDPHTPEPHDVQAVETLAHTAALVIERHHELTARAESERKLREREARLRFLGDLDHATQPLTDPDEIMRVTARMVGQHLGAHRCAYAEVEADESTFRVTGNYVNGVHCIMGRFTFDQFGETILRRMRANQPYVVHDIESDPQVGPDRSAYQQTAIAAVICVPVHKGGRLVAAMAVHQAEPRTWTSEEIELMEAVVTRCWETVGRARAERRLRESEERYRFMAESIPQIVFTARRDGATNYHNRRLNELTGAEREELQKKGWVAFRHPDDRERASAAWAQAVHEGRTYECEYRLRAASGEWRWHLARAIPMRDERGEVIQWFGTCTDIHDSRLQQEALRESEERYKLAAMATNDAIWDWNLQTGHVSWNQAMAERFGYEEAVGGTSAEWWLEHIHPDDRLRVRRGVMSVVDDPSQRSWRDEYRFQRANGSWATVFDRGTVLRSADGSPIRMVGAMQDVSERIQAEQERQQLLDKERAARAAAERAARLKDEFLATLSHELRTPLNAIVGWTYLLRKSVGDPEQVARGVEVIDRNARLQTQLISDLLDMSRITTGKMRLDMQHVELPPIIDNAVETVRSTAEAKGVRLEAAFAPVVMPVKGDPSRLQQVMWNLLSNAVKFTPREGRVDVILKNVDTHVEIVVSDTGQGIREDFLPHLFERFRQGDASASRRHGGLGIGLALARQLVELHGGTIDAMSEGEGRGATFVVKLPRAPELSAARIDEGPLVPSISTRALPGVRVLVVDDEADALEMVRRMLEACEVEVVTAGGVDEALRHLAVGPFDAILSDVGMPLRDGYDFIREVRLQGLEVPAAALTAFARPEDRARALRAGYQSFLTKPIEADELVATLAALTKRQA
jgi:PAS domain S-box-containing protein